jgi:outer membrane protein
VYTLQDAYDAALKANEAVKISEEDVLQAESRVDQALARIYPNLTGNGAYTRYNEVLPPDDGFVFQPIDEVRASLVLTQPLYTGGRTLAAWRVAKTLREASRNDLSTTKQTILLGTAEAYYAVIKARKLVEVSKNSLDRMERHRKVTEREAATRRTKANLSALLRANTLVNQARIGLVRAEDGLKIAGQRLSLIAKLPEDIEVVEPEEHPGPQGTIQAFQEAALMNRDDYTNAQLDQKVAEESVTITRGGHYPQLSAEAALRWTASEPDTQLDGGTYYAGLRLQVPIFEGGLMKAEVSEARSRKRQAELFAAFLKRQIGSEVHEAYINYQTVNSVLGTAKLQLADAKKNFDTVEGLFSQGLVQSLSLIDAESALSLAERELVDATWERQLAILRLERSMGLLGKARTVTSLGNEARIVSR